MTNPNDGKINMGKIHVATVYLSEHKWIILNINHSNM